MIELTFLTKDQVCDDEKKLEIFKKYGTNASITDFSLLLGVGVTRDHTSESPYNHDLRLKDTRAADYWTKTIENDKVIAISSYGLGFCGPKKINDREIGIRVSVNYQKIKNKIIDKRKINNILEVDYGEYPQTIVDKKLQMKLENLYKEGNLKTTGKQYTVNSGEEDIIFQTITEYEYKEDKYIRFVADRNIIRTRLSNKKYMEYNKEYWIKVEPITWLVDERENIAVTKKILLSGIPYNDKVTDNFEETIIYKFINYYLSKEIVPNNKTIKEIIQDMNLEELQELKSFIEKQIKEVKVKSIGGMK